LIGSLSDFKDENAVAYNDLPELDKWMLGRLTEVMQDVSTGYKEYQFYRVVQAIQQFVISDLSNFYLDIAKDRVYISGKNDFRRRSCQTVMKLLLENFAKAIAPILPHMAEDVWLNVPYQTSTTSIFQSKWILPKFPAFNNNEWAKIRQLRNDVNKVFETARNQKIIGASLEAQVLIHTNDENTKCLLSKFKGDDKLLAEPQESNSVDDLRFILMVSGVKFMESKEDILSICGDCYSQEKPESGCTVGILKAKGTKCERCWFHDETVGDEADHPTLCSRCTSIVRHL
jgi:isoleucyl-tRNA synthetase